jgi:L-ascorbate metabolism protein UlaG (beta-lactamase superfamily)
MKNQTCSLLITLALGLSLVPAQGKDAEPAAKKADQRPTSGGVVKASEMLKGVVHLSDDDVRFKTKSGVVVFVDPLAGPTGKLAAASGLVKPDLILITHPHEDHFQPSVLQEYLTLNPNVVLAGPGEAVKLAQDKGIQMQPVVPGQQYSLAGIEFRTVPAYFTESDAGHPKANQWVGYVLMLDGARYYVTGDTQPLPEMADTKADVIFPLLHGCGGNMDQALQMATISQARIVVPVHHDDQIGTIKKYIASLPKGVQSAYYTGGKLTVTP